MLLTIYSLDCGEVIGVNIGVHEKRLIDDFYSDYIFMVADCANRLSYAYGSYSEGKDKLWNYIGSVRDRIYMDIMGYRMGEFKGERVEWQMQSKSEYWINQCYDVVLVILVDGGTGRPYKSVESVNVENVPYRALVSKLSEELYKMDLRPPLSNTQNHLLKCVVRARTAKE